MLVYVVCGQVELEMLASAAVSCPAPQQPGGPLSEDVPATGSTVSWGGGEGGAGRGGCVIITASQGPSGAGRSWSWSHQALVRA